MSYSVNFGGQSINPSSEVVGIADSGTININNPFNLEVQLLSEGETLGEAHIYDLILTAGFWNNDTWTISSDPGTDYSGSAEIDFGNTLKFTSLSTPENVTWYSDSGVFLSQAVPIPSAIWLLTSGLFGLLWIRRKGR